MKDSFSAHVWRDWLELTGDCKSRARYDRMTQCLHLTRKMNDASLNELFKRSGVDMARTSIPTAQVPWLTMNLHCSLLQMHASSAQELVHATRVAMRRCWNGGIGHAVEKQATCMFWLHASARLTGHELSGHPSDWCTECAEKTQREHAERREEAMWQRRKLPACTGRLTGWALFIYPNDWNTECPKESQREEIRRREEAMQMRRRPPACFGCMPVQGPQVGCTLVIGGLSAWRGLQWKMLEGEKRLCR